MVPLRLTDWLLFYLPLTIAASSCLYHLAVTVAALRFARQGEPAAGFTPPVSILKPLRGIEQDFYATLRTFFQQDYPTYEIVFGFSDPQDPAQWTITQLQREFPRIPVKVVRVSGPAASGVHPANPKMHQLQPMLEQASHDVLVISDADIRVEPDYLRQVVAPLHDARVGLVTCLYRGVRARGLYSLLEALGMSGDFAGQVLLARWLGEVRFGLGATLATRKEQIQAIGGLAPWISYLADDFIVGNRIAASGYRVHLSHAVVETLLPRRTPKEYWQQQLRWARTVRACSPRGYAGLVLAFGAPLALLPVALQPRSTVALAVLAGAWIARWLAAWAAGLVVCGDKLVRNYFWLFPLRDLVALTIWLASFFGSEVVWRNARYRLEADGRVRAVSGQK
jgi:ceramide glucosyltransferase